MKSILASDGNRLFLVYPESTLQQLEACAGLNRSAVMTSRNLEALRPLLADVEVIFSTWGMPALTEEQIADYLPNLKEIYYSAGSVQFFARPFLARGVRIFSAWAANGVPVVEFALSQILLANIGYYQASRYQSMGELEKARAAANGFPGNYDVKVGILGAGMIGSMLIEKLHDYHVEVLVYDPFLSDERAAALGVRKASLEEIFTECQTISNHIANNAQTVGMLNYESCFKYMKDNATFINTGRGAQVVEDDLVRVLQEKPNATAVLDVTWPEPPVAGHPFYSLPNVFLTPHMAGSTGNEVHRMSLYMLEEYKRVHSGQAPLYEVTEDMLARMA
ncbi:MAG: hydroxyacid dehydrogenase [Firmicutes bacterium]|nr:hydroxyacid dehydrogenase [Bacillota bacterium]